MLLLLFFTVNHHFLCMSSSHSWAIFVSPNPPIKKMKPWQRKFFFLPTSVYSFFFWWGGTASHIPETNLLGMLRSFFVFLPWHFEVYNVKNEWIVSRHSRDHGATPGLEIPRNTYQTSCGTRIRFPRISIFKLMASFLMNFEISISKIFVRKGEGGVG